MKKSHFHIIYYIIIIISLLDFTFAIDDADIDGHLKARVLYRDHLSSRFDHVSILNDIKRISLQTKDIQLENEKVRRIHDKMVDAFGYEETVKIVRMAFEGFLEYTTVVSHAQNDALKDFCSYYRPSHSIVIFPGAVLRSDIELHQESITHCNILYHLALHPYATVFPDLPFASLVLTSRDQVSLFKELASTETLKNVQRLGIGLFRLRSFELLQLLKSTVLLPVKYLSISITRFLVSDFQRFLDFLVSPDNQLETIEINDLKGQLHNTEVNALQKTMKRVEFRVKKLKLDLWNDHHTAMIFNAVKDKVTHLKTRFPLSKTFFEDLSESAVVELEFFDYRADMENYSKFMARHLMNSLTSVTSKISMIKFGYFTSVSLHVFTDILRSKDNNLEYLSFNGIWTVKISSGREWMEFIEAVQSSPNSKLRYLKFVFGNNKLPEGVSLSLLDDVRKKNKNIVIEK